MLFKRRYDKTKLFGTLVLQNIWKRNKDKMRPSTRFMKFFYKLPEQARKELVYGYPDEPMTLNVCMVEIKGKTKLGKKILWDLGFRGE